MVRYKIKDKYNEEWIEKDSKRIAQVGKFSGKFDPNIHTPQEINNHLNRKKKFFTTTKNVEDNFKEELKSAGFSIREIQGDGNCLYRSFADQVYGNENYYQTVKSKCLDYLELEKDFFGQFIEGGIEKFDDYVKMKKIDGVWGDDIEIQAMSEIYNRPIEIYSYSKVPIKTFHENPSQSVLYEREISNLPPIRLSYHGKAHYNSVFSLDPNVFKQSLINFPAGVYEDKILEKVKLKQIQVKNEQLFQNPDNKIEEYEKKIHKDKDSKKMEFSRGNFIENGMKDLDLFLEKKFANEIIDKNEISAVLTDSVLVQKEHENDILLQTLEISKKEQQRDGNNLAGNYSIKFIIDMGFTMEEAIMAFSAVGDDPDLMLQFLYSLNI